MNELSEWLRDTAGIGSGTQLKLLMSAVAMLLLWLARLLVLKVAYRRSTDLRVRYRVAKSSRYVVGIMGILIVGRIWFEGIGSIATFLGLLSAGLAIALKDPIVNLAGWIFIIWRRPFEVGDRVQVGQHAGDVIDQRIFQFTLLEIGNWVHADQSTGRVIHIPNGLTFTEMLANYSKGFQYIWNEVPVLVTFESDWRKAKDVLSRIVATHSDNLSQEAQRKVREASKRFMIFYTKLTPVVYTSVQDCGVMLTIRYLCEPRNRRGTTERIWEEILDEFAKHDNIDFAYPTQRFYNNSTEGKQGARAQLGHSSDVDSSDPMS